MAVAALCTACENFLDVNDNPNAPETVTANLYLPPMLHWVATAPQFDGRYVGQYTEQWVRPQDSGVVPRSFARMGYFRGSDAAAQQWRDVYWTLGQNLVDLMNLSEAEERWDVLGVGYVLKAWGWLTLTSLHGEIIIQQAFDVTRFQFDYDTQEFAYQEVQRLLDEAIANLQRTDGAVDAGYLAVGDKIYNGDRTQWLKFAYGLKALALNHFSNKASYDPAQVIA
ncbi:MAG: SusD/RagB family nutrient-binding outer membrane lipoprotein, partial [Longimicrobiales bacterium]